MMHCYATNDVHVYFMIAPGYTKVRMPPLLNVLLQWDEIVTLVMNPTPGHIVSMIARCVVSESPPSHTFYRIGHQSERLTHLEKLQQRNQGLLEVLSLMVSGSKKPSAACLEGFGISMVSRRNDI